MMFLNIPATVGLIVLAGPIISVIFEHGRFTPDDTHATASALQLYAIGLVGYSIVRIVSPTFYALGRSRIPVAVSASSVVVNIALNITLVRWMGYRGLALGTSLTAIVNAAVQLFLLRRELKGIEGRRIAASFARVAIAAAVMGVLTYAAHGQLLGIMPGRSIPMQALRLGITISIALMVLVASAQVLKIPEYTEARDLVLGKLRRMAA
jgi:putative peptidoglycan lipid II flippase